MFIYSILMACSGLFASCSGDTYSYPGEAAPNATITVNQENISVSDAGGTYTLQVQTSGKEWNAYSNEEWIKVAAEYCRSVWYRHSDGTRERHDKSLGGLCGHHVWYGT